MLNGESETGAQDVNAPERIDPAPRSPGRRFAPSDSGARKPQGLEKWLPAPPALPWWVPNVYILAVIAVGIGMIAVGVASQEEDGEDEPRTFQAPPPEGSPAPSPGPGGASLAPPRQRPAPQRESVAIRRAKAGLDRVTVLGRFSIGVPAGWQRGMGGGGVVFRAPGGGAEVRMFLTSDAKPLPALARDARGYLRQRHPGARISSPRSVRLGPERAREVVARFNGGMEAATVLVSDGYAYLLLKQIRAEAPLRVKAAATASIRSFRAG